MLALLCFLFVPVKTTPNASQGICGCSRGMGSDHPRSASTVSEVARCIRGEWHHEEAGSCWCPQVSGTRAMASTICTSLFRGLVRSRSTTCCSTRKCSPSPWRRQRARGDGSPRISQGCETCSTGSSCQGAACSLRAICSKGGKTVGHSRRGANHAGEAVGGRQATSSETPRGSLPVTSTSTSAANRLGSTGCEFATEGQHSAVGAGCSRGANSGREGRCVVARNRCQTTHTTGSWPRTHPRHAHDGPRRTCPVVGDRQEDLQDAFAMEDDIGVLELTSKMAQGAERLIQLTRQPGTTTSSCCGELLARGDSLRVECCFGCREALVLERERQVRVARGPDRRGRAQDCGHYNGHGTATPKRVGMSFAGWRHSQSTPMTLMSHNPAHLVK